MKIQLFATICAAALCFSSGLNGQDWAKYSFENLHRDVCQSPDEIWRKIPWKTDLVDAQHAAIAESKPIFIWAMDGHPLGCT